MAASVSYLENPLNRGAWQAVVPRDLSLRVRHSKAALHALHTDTWEEILNSFFEDSFYDTPIKKCHILSQVTVYLMSPSQILQMK